MYSNEGTRREVSPETTLERIAGHWAEADITRCADLTGLDTLNIPVFAAFTPQNPALKVCWGKGCTGTHARVSALMEAVERSHLTSFDKDIPNSSSTELIDAGYSVISPSQFQLFNNGHYHDRDYAIDWAYTDSALHGDSTRYLIPASIIHTTGRKTNRFTANGVASGNSFAEAMSHALYEIIERHVVSSCFDEKGTLLLRHNNTALVDLDDCKSPLIASLNESINRAGATLRLFKLPSMVKGVSVFWAVILDEDNPLPFIRINIGYGAHLSSEISALRAITEAGQSRLAFIHGCREDMAHRIRRPHIKGIEKICKYFRSFSPSTKWDEAAKNCLGKTIENDYEILISGIKKAGFSQILYRILDSRIPSVFIVKSVVPGTRLNEGLF